MSGLVSLHLEVGAVAAVVFAQGESGLAVSRQVALVVGGRDDEEPVDAAGDERLGELSLALRLVVRAADERQDAARPGDLFEAPRCTAEKKGLATSSKARPTLAGKRSARLRDVAVTSRRTEQRDDVTHERRQRGVDGAVVVDDTRDRGEADGRRRRNIARGGPTAARKRSHICPGTRAGSRQQT
jgi:hypothetical protein